MPKLIARWWMAILTSWLCWALMAPVVFEAHAKIQPIDYNCPAPYVSHGVGSDLKTYTQRKDRCHAR